MPRSVSMFRQTLKTMNPLIAYLTEAGPRYWEKDAPGAQATDWELDPEKGENVMSQIGDRFKSERIAGFKHRETGAVVPPVSVTDAEKRWKEAELRFRSSLEKGYTPDAQKKLGGLWRQRQRTPADRAQRAEPSLSRGESMSRGDVSKMIS